MTVARHAALSFAVGAMAWACAPSPSIDGNPLTGANPPWLGNGDARAQFQEDGGKVAPDLATPGAVPADLGAGAGGDIGIGASGTVVISEIMYHPVLENADVERHEFIELHNPSDDAVTLAGWKLQIGRSVRFIFPDGARLPRGGYVVVAKSRTHLLALTKLNETMVVGDYSGTLENGGDTVTLLDAKGVAKDTVKYDDRAPWPIGADALGAGDDWFAPGVYAKEQYRGRSLERWSFTLSGSDPRNWEASAPGGGTPGKPNGVRGDPPAIALAVQIGALPTKPGDKVTLTVRMSAGSVTDLAAEIFVDDLEIADDEEPRTFVPLAGGPEVYTADLPGRKANTLVRYRVVTRRGMDVLAPRPGDPLAWHSYFVAPPLPGPRTHQILIGTKAWSRMFANPGTGPAVGTGACAKPNPTWNDRVPALYVQNGHVYEVRVRYLGGHYGRRSGYNIPKWEGPRPTGPAPLKAIGWNIAFPRYDRLDGRKKLALNKLYQSCPGITNAMEADLYRAGGVATGRMRFGRLYVNSQYYHYMMEVEDIDEDFVQGFEGDGKPIGDLFKVDGSVGDLGPWARGNFTPLQAACGNTITKLDRYRTNYVRQTHEWKGLQPEGHAEIAANIEELAPLYEQALARDRWGASADAWRPVRQFLEKRFDIEQLLTQWAIRNFVGVFDDGIHNYFLYRRPADGKWVVFPSDFDQELGGDSDNTKWRVLAMPPTITFYTGEEGTLPMAAENTYNRLKSALLKAFKTEYRERLVTLSKTVLGRENMLKLMGEAEAAFSMTDWAASPADKDGSCQPMDHVAKARRWIEERHRVFSGRLAAGVLDCWPEAAANSGRKCPLL